MKLLRTGSVLGAVVLAASALAVLPTVEDGPASLPGVVVGRAPAEDRGTLPGHVPSDADAAEAASVEIPRADAASGPRPPDPGAIGGARGTVAAPPVVPTAGDDGADDGAGGGDGSEDDGASRAAGGATRSDDDAREAGSGGDDEDDADDARGGSDAEESPGGGAQPVSPAPAPSCARDDDGWECDGDDAAEDSEDESDGDDADDDAQDGEDGDD